MGNLNRKKRDFVNKSDPYVKLEVEKDRWGPHKSFGKYRSTIKKNDLNNPVYEESFTFNDILSLENMQLKAKVKISDKKLGDCKIKLDKIRLDSGIPHTDLWKIDHRIFRKNAYIFLTITWND